MRGREEGHVVPRGASDIALFRSFASAWPDVASRVRAGSLVGRLDGWIGEWGRPEIAQRRQR